MQTSETKTPQPTSKTTKKPKPTTKHNPKHNQKSNAYTTNHFHTKQKQSIFCLEDAFYVGHFCYGVAS
jgi:acyl-coenzyme A synthetase/AMP-(fatty) acid ligase